MSRAFTQEYLAQNFRTNMVVIEVNVPMGIQKIFNVVLKDFER